MTLRDTEAVRRWIAREHPSALAVRALVAFLSEAGERPWRAPSTPIDELSEQPSFQVRNAILPVEGEPPVEVWYRNYYESDDVDIVEVTNQ